MSSKNSMPNAEQEQGHPTTNQWQVVAPPTSDPQSVVPDTHATSQDNAWDMAYDEKYGREGKTGLLQPARESRPGEISDILPDAIEDLHNAYDNGANITTIFNGVPLNSREIGELGLKRAYKKFTGLNKKDFEEHELLAQKMQNEEDSIRQRAAQKAVPWLMHESKDLVNPELADEWNDALVADVESPDPGQITQTATALMLAHDLGEKPQDLVEIIQKGQTKTSLNKVVAIIRQFYNKSDSLLADLSVIADIED